MNKIYTTVLSLILLTTFNGQAQNTHDGQNLPQAKTDYIHKKAYLSESSTKDYKSFYGDSLDGFNEALIKTQLLNKGLYGSEFLGHLTYLKRQYIQSKYHLGTTSPTLNAQSGSKGIGGFNTVNAIPCVNEGFESTSPGTYSTANGVSGWTVSSRIADSQCTPTLWAPGSSEFSIVATPIASFSVIGAIPNSPLGGSNVALLNDFSPNYKQTKLTQTFPVTTSNFIFQFAYAGIYQDGGHLCCEQPQFQLLVKDCSGNLVSCHTPTLRPNTSGCPSSATTYSYSSSAYAFFTNWQLRSVDLSAYIGSCITVEAICSDCPYGGHYGCTLFDASCGNYSNCINCSNTGLSSVNFCPGSTQATIQAPIGNTSYSWIAPPNYTAQLSPSQATLSAITITNPVVGAVFTVNVISSSGCFSSINYTLANSQVGVGSSSSYPACPLSSNGSATVFATGSNTGYTYTWLNSTSSVVSTASVATNLSSGMYTVNISSSSCGSAVATVSVAAVQPSLGLLSNNFVCEGATNGYVVVDYNPGYNSVVNKTITVLNTPTTPAYAYTGSSNSNTFAISNLFGSGSYSFSIQDGNCISSSLFFVSTNMVSNTFSIGPVSSTLCQGQSVIAGVSVTGTNTPALSYSWSPVTFLLGNYGNSAQTAITPTCAPGTMSTLVYTIAVTSLTSNCTVSKTLAVTVANPGTPTILSTPQICTNSGPVQINAIPPGGTFNSNSAVSSVGLITPSLAVLGSNSFNYVYSLAGCLSSVNGSFALSPPISIGISGNTSICDGQSTTLLASGGSFYNWSNGTNGAIMNISPHSTTTYSVTGVNGDNTCSNGSSVTVTVHPLPVLQVSGDTLICDGESTQLNVGGANTYLWNTGATSSVIVVSPHISTSYSVQGTNTLGSCSSTVMTSVIVQSCTGISSKEANTFNVAVYPNPTKGSLFIETDSDLQLSLSDGLGRIVIAEKQIQKGKQSLDMSTVASGVYFLTLKNAQDTQIIKVVKTE